MLVKNVKSSWAFLGKEDNNGNYRITFAVSDEQDKEIQRALAMKLAENSKAKPESVEWFGSRKIDEQSGEVTYTAKASKTYKNKKGETVERSLAVYNKRAQLYADGTIPNIANGAIVNLVIEPYYASHLKRQGVMLGLRSVQLLEFQEYCGDNPFKDETGDAPFQNEVKVNYLNNDGSLNHSDIIGGDNGDDIFA